jgi:hypothetical protein
MRICILAAAAALAVVGLSARDVRAEGSVFPPPPPYYGPFANNHPNPFFSGMLAYFRGGQVLPVYQAAPWYLYWPYDAHFLTAAPVGGAFYAPPTMGNFSGNPYFPGGPVAPWPAPAGAAPVVGPASYNGLR